MMTHLPRISTSAHRWTQRWHLPIMITLLAVGLMGCGADDGDTPATTGAADGTAQIDGSGAQDGGNGADGATTDAGTTDAGTTDAGTSDGGGTDAGAPAPRPFNDDKIGVAGVWQSSFGGNETLSDAAWVTGFGTATVAKFDNTSRTVFTQNAKDDKYNPSKFNKIVWTKPAQVDVDGFKIWTTYYCTVAFGQDSLALAEQSTQTADATAPEKSGCGTFPWTKLSALATVGDWQTNFGSSEKINRQAWGFTWVRGFDNTKKVAYTQNPKDAKYGPSTWNKVVWTNPTAGKWYHCTVDFGLKGLAEAKATSKTADAKDLTGKGCGGFPWTEMSASK